MYLSKDKKAQLKTYKKLKRKKNLKKVALKNDVPLRMKVGLIKMGFDIESMPELRN